MYKIKVTGIGGPDFVLNTPFWNKHTAEEYAADYQTNHEWCYGTEVIETDEKDPDFVDFTKKTKQGYSILALIDYKDETLGKVVVFKQAPNNYGWGNYYNTEDGTWAHGNYDLRSVKDAINDIANFKHPVKTQVTIVTQAGQITEAFVQHRSDVENIRIKCLELDSDSANELYEKINDTDYSVEVDNI